MKKSFFAVILALCLLISLLPAAQATSETDVTYPIEGGNIYFDKTTGTITGCTRTATGAVIPEKIDGVAVTSIGDDAFWLCKSLKTVTIPNSVTSIGGSAFCYCVSLTEVTIPDSVTSIGTSAFSDCTSLTSIKIPAGVTQMGVGVFAGCESLTAIDVDESNPSYCSTNGMLFTKDMKTLLQCPGGVTGAVIVPDGVTNIEYCAFSSCADMTSVSIPGSVRSIGEAAFEHCGSLTGVTLPDGLERIGQSAFYGCGKLRSLNIPDSVTGIGQGVIEGTPLYARAWDGSVFYLDHWLIKARHYEYIGDYTVRPGTIGIADDAFSFAQLTSIVMPDSLSYIGKNAFSWCADLTNVRMSNNVTKIEEGTFYNCSALSKLTLMDGVESIGQYAFGGCNALKRVKIPESTTRIEWGAFSGCAFTNVTIPDSVTCIDEFAFEGCRELTSITIPKNVTSIGMYAFYGCSSLTAVNFEGDAPVELGEGVFQELADQETNTNRNIPGLTLYYIAGKKNWTTPTWQGYPTATWQPEEHPALSFHDVPKNEWYVKSLDYAVENYLMGGVGNNRFEPEESMTRAMLVTVLWRYQGEPKAGKNVFSDVPDNTWYTDAVVWAAANNIVGGVGGGRFDPEGKISREQMATILFRYAKRMGIDTGKRGDLTAFPDGDKVAGWAREAMQWAVAEGIIGGSDGKLLPQGSATRAQVATILMRYIEDIECK